MGIAGRYLTVSMCPSSLQDDRATHQPSVKVAIFEKKVLSKKVLLPSQKCPGSASSKRGFF